MGRDHRLLRRGHRRLTPVFADVDTGIDDALALVFLLASSDADLIGLAATAGNVSVDQVCRNNLGLLRVCGRSGVPVSREPTSRWQPHCARPRTPTGRRAWAMPNYWHPPSRGRPSTTPPKRGARRACPSRRSGRGGHRPLTNLALALRAEPALPSLLGRLVVVGGRNTVVDPEAAAEVYAAWGRAAQANVIGVDKLPLLCGPDVTERAVVTLSSCAAWPMRRGRRRIRCGTCWRTPFGSGSRSTSNGAWAIWPTCTTRWLWRWRWIPDSSRLDSPPSTSARPEARNRVERP